jgi:two-component system chemotaxis sensor kinase CheA
MVTAWQPEPITRRFERVAEQAGRLARRMGKDVRVEIDDCGIRLDPQRWATFWSTFVHAVRNAIDHGIEDASERQRLGKPETARVSLRSTVDNGALTIEIRDDGRGIDWDRVRERARAAGLPHDSRDQLINAVFTDGFSTRDEASEVSGRGVGLAVLRAVAVDSGGKITLASERQRGTSLRFSFPLDRLSDAERARGRARSTRIPVIATA